MDMKEKLWGGRFRMELNENAKEFSYSLHVDKRLFLQDIKVNLIHAKALVNVGVISKEELSKIEACFKSLEKRYNNADETLFSGNDEDIHSCVERLVTEELGDLGKKIHTGKSRNDQVITDFKLYLKEEIVDINCKIEELIKVLFDLAKENIKVLMPGFTHMQPAQPVLFSHHLLAYAEKFISPERYFPETWSN